MNDFIDQYQDVIIHITTQSGTGTGFCLRDRGLIVTNNHVVANNREVIISGRKIEKCMARVVYFDPLNDLAFIQLPEGIDVPPVRLAERSVLKEGESIVAIGHPFELKYTATQGIVSKAQRLYRNLNYIQIDAAINPGNSGGPLVNQAGEIVGVNTFIIEGGDNLGFSLPVDYLKKSLDDYQPVFGQSCYRCPSCSNLIVMDTATDAYCSSCGAKLELPAATGDTYTPVGAAALVEQIISQLGKDVKLSRRGPNRWEIKEGSATIYVMFNDKTGFIVGDAFLCLLPKANLAALYEYLLRENYSLPGLTLSVYQQDIVLSLLIFHEALVPETGVQLFRDLFKKADEYDNILIERYGALPKVVGD